MIVYDLKCRKGHQFEAWFRDSAAFDTQAKAEKVQCPTCGDRKIGKALMAPNISSRKELSSDEHRKMVKTAVQQLSQLRDQVEKNCENVGERFAEEARKIHYGETGKRNIYGDATQAEADALLEEGVEFSRIPWLPRHDS